MGALVGGNPAAGADASFDATTTEAATTSDAESSDVKSSDVEKESETDSATDSD
jgi:hypothetical protein